MPAHSGSSSGRSRCMAAPSPFGVAAGLIHRTTRSGPTAKRARESRTMTQRSLTASHPNRTRTRPPGSRKPHPTPPAAPSRGSAWRTPRRRSGCRRSPSPRPSICASTILLWMPWPVGLRRRACKSRPSACATAVRYSTVRRLLRGLSRSWLSKKASSSTRTFAPRARGGDIRLQPRVRIGRNVAAFGAPVQILVELLHQDRITRAGPIDQPQEAVLIAQRLLRRVDELACEGALNEKRRRFLHRIGSAARFV